MKNASFPASIIGTSLKSKDLALAPVVDRSVFRKDLRLNQSEGICLITEKFGKDHHYCGVRRILIELESEPQKAQEYAQKYADLVDDLAKILIDDLHVRKGMFGSGKEVQKQFFEEMWSLMKSNLDIHYGNNENGFLYESLDTRKGTDGTPVREWDCDNSSFLVFDVGRKIGLDIQLIFVHYDLFEQIPPRRVGHVLVKTRHFSFETTSGKLQRIGIIPNIFQGINKTNKPVLEKIINSLEIAQSGTYNTRGCARYKIGDLEGAMDDFKAALELNPSLKSAEDNLKGLQRHERNVKQRRARPEKLANTGKSGESI